ncbi:Allantoinase [Corynebacterium provencense]|jgi:allantoinase|uniref:allantoinase n=1 Tax=Corynebacterium provencense TaxID=1737425 RepID=A0A2Z3YLP1_9CORY|nr:allantoinase AllB [Corynebacterium provencense]AWT25145.1 Allantoinase [Corynebacterium provencense]MCI1255596.1 allantoinase AllB [Corynebacterium provencense]
MTTRIFRAAQAVYLPEEAGPDSRPTLGPATVVTDGATIVSVLPGLQPDVHAGHDAEIIEIPDDQVLIPGLVDTHVHVNEPGRTTWEGFTSVTRAAASGGVTTLLDMPLNSVPSTVTVDALDTKQAVAKDKVKVNVGFWGGVVPENIGTGDLRALWDRGVFGFKCFLLYSGVDEFQPLDKDQLRAAMREIAEFDGLLIVHAEDGEIIDEATEKVGAAGGVDETFDSFLASRPSSSEAAAIATVIAAAEETGCRAHILHLSDSGSIDQIAAAQERGVRISAETCPHYLSLFSEEIQNGATQYKCCPPIRTAGNRERLWKGLVDGVIGTVVSDHSPCTAELKRFAEAADAAAAAGVSDDLVAFSALAAKGNDLGAGGADHRGSGGSFATAWGGIGAVELGLPVVWSQARLRGLDITDVVRWMCQNPAEWAGLSDRGAIQAGRRADLVQISADDAFVVLPENLNQRNKVTAYAQRALAGVVTRTFIDGEPVYVRPSAPRPPAAPGEPGDRAVFPGDLRPFTLRP